MASVNFKLGSDYGRLLTETARDKAWNDGNESDAVIFLMDNLHGMSTDQARRIVNGKKKLETAENRLDVDLIDDDWEPPMKDINAAKNEVYEICNMVIREKDFHGVAHYVGWQGFCDSGYEGQRMGEMKSVAYSIKELADVKPMKALEKARELKEQYIALATEISEWQFERQELTSKMSYLELDKMRKASEGHDMSGVLDEMKADMMAKIATSDMDEESKRRLIRSTKGITDAMERGADIEEDKKFHNDTGWLSPDGKFYGCEYGQHIPLGHALAEKFYPDESVEAEGRLEGHGWAKVGIKQWYFVQGKFTVKQVASIKKWAKVHGNPIILNGCDYDVSELKDFNYTGPEAVGDEIRELAKDLPRLEE